jgi:hypothetical protein
MKRKFTDKVAKTIGSRTFRPEVHTVRRKYAQKIHGSAD